MTSHSCPNCGMSISCDTPRHGPRGSGAHYADRIRKLNRTHNHAQVALEGHDSFDRGLGLTEVWKRVREYCLANNFRVPTKQGMSGRLSELAGLGMVRSENNQIRLTDQQSQQYRFEKQPRWFLSEWKSPHRQLAEQTGIYGIE